MVRIAGFYRYTFVFVGVLSATFLVLAIWIFSLPKRINVQSSIELASTFKDDKQEAIDPPEMIAKSVSILFAPSTLLELANKTSSPSKLNQLKNPTVETVGRTLVVSNFTEPDVEHDAKIFQQTIAEHIIARQTPYMRAMRDALEERIASATRVSDLLGKEISSNAEELERIARVSDELQSQIKDEQKNLTALYGSSGSLSSDEQIRQESQIRELQWHISNQVNNMSRLELQRSDLLRLIAANRRHYEAQNRLISDLRLQQRMSSETRLVRSPTTIPSTTGASRPVLLVVALITSLLVALGSVVLLHNFAGRRVQTPAQHIGDR